MLTEGESSDDTDAEEEEEVEEDSVKGCIGWDRREKRRRS